MGKTKIGIKYCGGCNPNYERVEMIQRIESLVGERFLFLRHDQEDLDGLLAVNGCLRACAAGDLSQRGVPYYSVLEKGDFDSAIKWMLAFIQQGTKVTLRRSI